MITLNERDFIAYWEDNSVRDFFNANRKRLVKKSRWQEGDYSGRDVQIYKRNADNKLVDIGFIARGDDLETVDQNIFDAIIVESFIEQLYGEDSTIDVDEIIALVVMSREEYCSEQD